MTGGGSAASVASRRSAGVFDGGNSLDELTVCALTPCFQQGTLTH